MWGGGGRCGTTEMISQTWSCKKTTVVKGFINVQWRPRLRCFRIYGVFGGVRDRWVTCDVKQKADNLREEKKTGGGREKRYCRVTEREMKKGEGPED